MEKGHIVRRLENEPSRRSSSSIATRWTSTSSSSAADQTIVVRPRERYTGELLRPDPNDPVYKTNPGSYASELHERFASPLYTFAFVLLVLAFMGQAQTTRTSRMQAVIAAFAVAVFNRILGITCANCGRASAGCAAALRGAPAPRLSAACNSVAPVSSARSRLRARRGGWSNAWRGASRPYGRAGRRPAPSRTRG